MRLSAALLLLQLAAPAIAVAQAVPPAPRRQPVTAELERTAFADARARTLLHRARAARLSQDSALAAYEARTYQRLTIGFGVRRVGLERLLLRAEHAARVSWSRDVGLWIQPTGRRAVAPMFPDAAVQTDILTALSPVPWFPGREALWLPASYVSTARAEVNEEDLLHPLATGAEAYYRYATGDSVSIRLPDGRVISLRELRITARRPEWRAFVGSFWFDVEQGALVRAAYRLAAEIDFWQLAGEEHRREIEKLEERLRTDTGAALREARERLGEERDDEPGWIAKGMFSPLRANVSAITVEYGLHEGRFWLPKIQTAEGEAQAGFVRIPVKFEESFRYSSVNAALRLPAIPTPAQVGLAPSDTFPIGGMQVSAGNPARIDTSTTARHAREDSLVRHHLATADSLRRTADSVRTLGDTARVSEMTLRADRLERQAHRITSRRAACSSDSSHVSHVSSRFGGALRVAIRMPCDTTRLATSPDLPGTIYDPGEEGAFPTEAVEELLASLDLSLQPGFAPQPPQLHTGLDLLRYNRVEGLSAGATARMALGAGYSAFALARIGTADLVPNGELSVARSNGRRELTLGAFHRLGVANDDWGAPLSFGASAANLLYARDEGFYYRTWGAELAGARDAPGPLRGATLDWRLFAERHRSAGVAPNTQLSLARAFGDTRFGPNIDALELTALGAGGQVARAFGVDPMGLRMLGRARAEAAFTNAEDAEAPRGYGRLTLDGMLTRALGPLALSLTGAGGWTGGGVPIQRAFFVGGLHTVRGQFARLAPGYVGNSFWLARTEIGTSRVAMRPTVFYDIGWAGARDDFTHPGRPLSGAGAGLSFLDGLARIDLARGIWPERKWRLDVQMEARF